jgi:hypothetical protein
MLQRDNRLQGALLRLVRGFTMRVRKAYYIDQPSWSVALALLPVRIRSKVGLTDEDARTSHRVEIGAGIYPQPGFVHFDADWTANHLEARTNAWSLPVPDGWAREIVAVHLLEHIRPVRVNETLAEWRRALAPGGRIQIHVPDSRRLMERFVEVDPPEKWKFMAALLGTYGNSSITRPEQIERPADHQLMFDPPLLTWLFEQAGFVDVKDVSSSVSDRHTEGWADAIDQISIIVTARKAA